MNFTPQGFNRCFRALGLSPPAPRVFHALQRAYSAPTRFYHTHHHIDFCLTHLDASAHLAERPAEIEVALWFHDAVYNSRRFDNEARSAVWAARILADCQAGEATIHRVTNLIRATQGRSHPTSNDTQLIVDIDLAILGQPPDVFAQYDTQIRQEYAWVPEADYRWKRRQVLESFLTDRAVSKSSPYPIYSTSFFRDRYEESARRNLQAAIQRLVSIKELDVPP